MPVAGASNERPARMVRFSLARGIIRQAINAVDVIFVDDGDPFSLQLLLHWPDEVRDPKSAQRRHRFGDLALTKLLLQRLSLANARIPLQHFRVLVGDGLEVN